MAGKWRKFGTENNPRRVILHCAGTWSRNIKESLGFAVFTFLFNPWKCYPITQRQQWKIICFTCLQSLFNELFFFFLIGVTNLDAYEEDTGNEDGQVKYLAFSLNTGEKGKCGGWWQVGLRCGFRGDRAEASFWTALDLKGASSHPAPPILPYWTMAHIAWSHRKKKKAKVRLFYLLVLKLGASRCSSWI